MFDFLLNGPDDAAVDHGGGAAAPAPPAPGPIPAVALAAAAAPAVAVPRRGRNVIRLAFARGAKKSRTIRAQRDAVLSVCNPTLRRSISKEIFGVNTNAVGRERVKMASSLTVDAATTFAVDKRRQQGRKRRRGLSCHVKAVRTSLLQFCQQGTTLIDVDILDDATMWVRKRMGVADKKACDEKDRRNRRQGRKAKKATGRNVAVPVMNFTQHCYIRTPSKNNLRGVQIHAPATPLPQANWSTILNRKRRWGVCVGTTAGRNVSQRSGAENSLQKVIDSMPNINKLMTNDAAIVNDCICRAEQSEMVAARSATRYRCHVDIHCQAHQWCLTTRPVIEEESDLATIIVRLSHLMQGGLKMDKILEACDALVTDIFEYKEVIDYPEGYDEWQRDAEWILEGSSDLTEADCLAIRQHGNSNWKTLKWIHYCKVLGQCPSGCRDAAHSLEIAKVLARTFFSMGLPVALAYRWKHMDTALKFMLRGRLFYSMLPRILARVWTPKAIRDAEAEADEMGLENLTFTAQTAVKASTVLRYFDRDADGKGLVRTYAATQPLNHSINAVMNSDKLSMKWSLVCSTQPDTAAAIYAGNELRKSNYSFISGTRGMKVIAQYTSMVSNLDGPLWHKWRLNAEDRLDAAWRMLKPCAQSWRRSVFYFLDPRFQVFEATTTDGGNSFNYDQDHLFECFAKLKRRQYCPDCLDTAFAQEVVRKYDHAGPRAAFEQLDNVLLCIKVGSGIVERLHLIGEELKPARSRGLALDGRTLSEISYLKAVQYEANAKSRAAHDEILTKHGLSLARYIAISRAFRVDGNRRPDDARAGGVETQVKVVTKETLAGPRRRLDGYRVFRTRHFAVRAKIGTDPFKAEEARAQGLWRALPDEERAVYEGQAAANEVIAQNVSENLSMEQVSANRDALGENRSRRLQQDLFLKVLDSIKAHPMWDCGLRLGNASTALKPDLINVDSNDATITQEMEQLFGYDPKIVPNPRGTMIPLRSCHSSNWGLCKADCLAEACRNGVANVYEYLLRWGIRRNRFPICIRFRHAGLASYYILCDTFGAGVTIFFIKFTTAADDDDGIIMPSIGYDRGWQVMTCLTGQMALQAFLRRCGSGGLGPGHVNDIGFAIMQHTKINYRGSLALRLEANPSHEAQLSLATLLRRHHVATKGGTGPAPLVLPFGLSAEPDDLFTAGFDIAHDLGLGTAGPANTDRGVGDPDARPQDDEPYEDAPYEDALAPDADLARQEESLHAVPTGARVGVVGVDYTRSDRSLCCACIAVDLAELAKIPEGVLRFYFRRDRFHVERSLYPGCVLNKNVLRLCSPEHLQQSRAYLSSIALDDFPVDDRVVILDAADVFAMADSGAVPSAGSHG